MAYRMIQIGTGGFGGAWCRAFLPPNVADGLIEVVAAVDVNADALAHAREHLGLSEKQCYTDVARALDESPADFCTIVVPPAYHEEIVDLALAHDLHILSEKPIADTLEASVRIADKVQSAGKKMGVTMSHRFDQDKTTLREEVRSGRHGPLDYLSSRMTCDLRDFGSWGKFRHEMEHPLLIEGAVHHLDLLADLAGAKCAKMLARTWNAPWGEYAGDPNGLAFLTMENGTRAIYEAGNTNAVGLNCWTREYIRAECRDTTLVLSGRRLEAFPREPERGWRPQREGEGAEIPLLEQPKWSNPWLIERFVRWLDGDEPMETNVEANLQSMAMVFAAVESASTGAEVDVQGLLAGARAIQ